MGTKHGRGPGTFVDETHAAATAYCRDVLQRLRAWQAKAPKLAEEPVDDQIVTDTELADEPTANANRNGESAPETVPALPRGFKVAAGVKVNADGSIDIC